MLRRCASAVRPYRDERPVARQAYGPSPALGATGAIRDLAPCRRGRRAPDSGHVSGDPEARSGATSRTVVGWLRGVGTLLLTVAAVEYLLLPRLVEARGEVSVLADVSAALLVPAVVLQAASLAAYTCLTQVILRGGPSLPFGIQLRIDLTGYGTSHVVPGGGATAAALRYRLMVLRGLPAEVAASLAAVQTVLAVLGLLLVATVGQLFTALRIGVNPMTLGLVVAVLVALTVGGSFLAHEPPSVRAAEPRRSDTWPRLQKARRTAEVWGRRVARVTGQSRDVLRAAPTRRRGLAWSVTNWLLDAACLWVCLAAYGEVMSPELVLSAYGVAGLVGLVPITPGGLGVVEGTLVPGLVVLGGASGPVVLGVLTWRLLQFWLPVPVAAVAWLSLRWDGGGRRSRRSVLGGW